MFTSPGPELIRLGPLTLRGASHCLRCTDRRIFQPSGQKPKSRNRTDQRSPADPGAHLGHRSSDVLRGFRMAEYADDWMKALAIWEGGIAIHGALISGTLTLLFFAAGGVNRSGMCLMYLCPLCSWPVDRTLGQFF